MVSILTGSPSGAMKLGIVGILVATNREPLAGLFVFDGAPRIFQSYFKR